MATLQNGAKVVAGDISRVQATGAPDFVTVGSMNAWNGTQTVPTALNNHASDDGFVLSDSTIARLPAPFETDGPPEDFRLDLEVWAPSNVMSASDLLGANDMAFAVFEDIVQARHDHWSL